VNATPLEPGWKGHITIELSNLSPNPIRLIAGRGIGQVLLFDLAYPAEYEGIYQNQPKAPIPSCGQILRELEHIYEGWVRPTEK
jgi:dCTP deaminase